jgi:hypothetical protein
MTFNDMAMIQQNIRNNFELLLSTATDASSQQCTADQMERHLFEQLLRLGANLLQLFFDARSLAYPRTEAVHDAGQTFPYHGERSRDYLSVFGKLEITRPYFYQRQEGGYSPLDAELGLGQDSYSDFLRELHDELDVHVPFEKATKLLDRLLGIHLSKRCAQQFVATDAADVAAFYEAKPPPPVEEEASILVVQADGKGVPIIKASAKNEKVRLKRGEARSRKKAVTATAIYTIQPAPRAVEDVVASLVPDGREQAATTRSSPQHKEIWGTLAGKKAALDRLQREGDKRMGDHIQQRVMLCDGDKSLQAHLLERFPEFTLILDFIHAYEYLWQVANALYGQDSSDRLPWVVDKTRTLLSGQSPSLVTTFRQLAQEKGGSANRRKTLLKVANYFENNQPYMDYAAYLEKGWPIASGVIEGVCRHFVKDRMELSGMRWSEDGAENLLHLRAVAENDDWEAYHRFRKQQRQQRLYQRDWPQDLLLPTLSRPSRRSKQTYKKVMSAHASAAEQSYARLPLAV